MFAVIIAAAVLATGACGPVEDDDDDDGTKKKKKKKRRAMVEVEMIQPSAQPSTLHLGRDVYVALPV